MARVFIAFPNRSYAVSHSELLKLQEWILTHRIKGDPDFSGALILPRYKGKSINAESLTERIKDSPYWRSGMRLDIKSDDAMNYFRDLELPRDAEVLFHSTSRQKSGEE